MEDILVQEVGEYYMDVREFTGGGIEVLVKAIRPMHEAAIRSGADPLSYVNACRELGETSSTVSAVHIPADKQKPDEYELQQNHLRAVRRAKQNIRWCVQELQADRLLTLTYRENMTDREKLKKDVTRFVRLVRTGWAGQKGYPDWQYTAVVELQERGAYHVHFAVRGWQRINFLRAAWFKALGGQGYERGVDTPGNVDITSPKKARWGTQSKEWQTGKLAAYITKYLAKTFSETTIEKRRYWHSRDLKPPFKQRYMMSSLTMVQAIKEAVSIIYFAYGLAIDFTRSWMSPCGDCLWLSLGEST